MVWNLFAVCQARLCRTDVQMTEDLYRIVINDFAGEAMRKVQREIRLTAGRGTNDRNDRVLRSIYQSFLSSIPL